METDNFLSGDRGHRGPNEGSNGELHVVLQLGYANGEFDPIVESHRPCLVADDHGKIRVFGVFLIGQNEGGHPQT
jgi:hypothetical protein